MTLGMLIPMPLFISNKNNVQLYITILGFEKNKFLFKEHNIKYDSRPL